MALVSRFLPEKIFKKLIKNETQKIQVGFSLGKYLGGK